jgi:outer membrane biosynthesis protein TonB
MKLLTVNIIFIFSLSAFSQSKSGLEKILENQAAFIAECESGSKETPTKNSGRILPEISGECEWVGNGCPVSLVKPFFPETAKRFGISGAVEVETIIDERGKVVYAKSVRGNAIFYASAERAAYLSRFRPKIFCGKAVYQKRIIRYYFISK